MVRGWGTTSHITLNLHKGVIKGCSACQSCFCMMVLQAQASLVVIYLFLFRREAHIPSKRI